MDLIQDLHDRIEHDITTDELIAMTNFAIMILRERTDDSINYNMSTKQISTLARVVDKETSTFRKNYDKDDFSDDLPF
jgi:hypothetical protein|tara:strand:- start:30 stop:263 length:234 start_codon:yes stop_codon:yes gene_type:complete